MGLNVNNLIIGNKSLENVSEAIEETIEEVVEEVKEIIESEPLPPEPVSLVSDVPTRTDKKHGILIVNGKEKKISRQSAYLLDMLSIDND